MNENTKNPLRRFLREEKLPHFFCAGCGCGQVLNCYCQALDQLDMHPEHMVTIGGVGCTARIPVYLKTDVLHGVHGRTLAWATGIKLMQPDLPVVIFAGDGDLTSIGGNHFIHAARRNLDVTVVMVNNMNFAMTGGQVAPTSPENSRTMTTLVNRSGTSVTRKQARKTWSRNERVLCFMLRPPFRLPAATTCLPAVLLPKAQPFLPPEAAAFPSDPCLFPQLCPSARNGGSGSLP